MKKKIIWFTGLSGAGKSTLSRGLLPQLQKKFGIKKKNIISIDGDIFRKKKKLKVCFQKKILLTIIFQLLIILKN